MRSPALVGIMAEPGIGIGLKGSIRRLNARLEGFRIASKVNFVLSIGHLGHDWYRLAGYPSCKLFPYGYFVEGASVVPTKTRGKVRRLIFIGQLVRRKGVDLLLEALSGLRDLDFELVIVGDGVSRGHYENLSTKLGLSRAVKFIGSAPNREALQTLAEMDVLVLPSRWDGWGAVVNEALMRGVRVVCSSKCGAADLIRSPSHGAVFQSGSILALRTVLRRIMADEPRPDLAREALSSWARCLEGEYAARYLLDVVDSVRRQQPGPTPPWMAPWPAA